MGGMDVIKLYDCALYAVGFTLLVSGRKTVKRSKFVSRSTAVNKLSYSLCWYLAKV